MPTQDTTYEPYEEAKKTKESIDNSKKLLDLLAETGPVVDAMPKINLPDFARDYFHHWSRYNKFAQPLQAAGDFYLELSGNQDMPVVERTAYSFYKVAATSFLSELGSSATITGLAMLLPPQLKIGSMVFGEVLSGVALISGGSMALFNADTIADEVLNISKSAFSLLGPNEAKASQFAKTMLEKSKSNSALAELTQSIGRSALNGVSLPIHLFSASGHFEPIGELRVSSDKRYLRFFSRDKGASLNETKFTVTDEGYVTAVNTNQEQALSKARDAIEQRNLTLLEEATFAARDPREIYNSLSEPEVKAVQEMGDVSIKELFSQVLTSVETFAEFSNLATDAKAMEAYLEKNPNKMYSPSSAAVAHTAFNVVSFINPKVAGDIKVAVGAYNSLAVGIGQVAKSLQESGLAGLASGAFALGTGNILGAVMSIAGLVSSLFRKKKPRKDPMAEFLQKMFNQLFKGLNAIHSDLRQGISAVLNKIEDQNQLISGSFALLNEVLTEHHLQLLSALGYTQHQIDYLIAHQEQLRIDLFDLYRALTDWNAFLFNVDEIIDNTAGGMTYDEFKSGMSHLNNALRVVEQSTQQTARHGHAWFKYAASLGLLTSLTPGESISNVEDTRNAAMQNLPMLMMLIDEMAKELGITLDFDADKAMSLKSLEDILVQFTKLWRTYSQSPLYLGLPRNSLTKFSERVAAALKQREKALEAVQNQELQVRIYKAHLETFKQLIQYIYRHLQQASAMTYRKRAREKIFTRSKNEIQEIANYFAKSENTLSIHGQQNAFWMRRDDIWQNPLVDTSSLSWQMAMSSVLEFRVENRKYIPVSYQDGPRGDIFNAECSFWHASGFRRINQELQKINQQLVSHYNQGYSHPVYTSHAEFAEAMYQMIHQQNVSESFAYVPGVVPIISSEDGISENFVYNKPPIQMPGAFLLPAYYRQMVWPALALMHLTDDVQIESSVLLDFKLDQRLHSLNLTLSVTLVDQETFRSVHYPVLTHQLMSDLPQRLTDIRQKITEVSLLRGVQIDFLRAMYRWYGREQNYPCTSDMVGPCWWKIHAGKGVHCLPDPSEPLGLINMTQPMQVNEAVLNKELRQPVINKESWDAVTSYLHKVTETIRQEHHAELIKDLQSDPEVKNLLATLHVQATVLKFMFALADAHDVDGEPVPLPRLFDGMELLALIRQQHKHPEALPMRLQRELLASYNEFEAYLNAEKTSEAEDSFQQHARFFTEELHQHLIDETIASLSPKNVVELKRDLTESAEFFTPKYFAQEINRVAAINRILTTDITRRLAASGAHQESQNNDHSSNQNPDVDRINDCHSRGNAGSPHWCHDRRLIPQPLVADSESAAHLDLAADWSLPPVPDLLGQMTLVQWALQFMPANKVRALSSDEQYDLLMLQQQLPALAERRRFLLGCEGHTELSNWMSSRLRELSRDIKGILQQQTTTANVLGDIRATFDRIEEQLTEKESYLASLRSRPVKQRAVSRYQWFQPSVPSTARLPEQLVAEIAGGHANASLPISNVPRGLQPH